MTSYWARSATCCGTAFCLAVALVLSVFSQSHSALGHPAYVGLNEPCSDHVMGLAAVVAQESCLTLCKAAELGHMLGNVFQRYVEPSNVVSVVVYDTPIISASTKQPSFMLRVVRSSPEISQYLTTQRLQL